MPSISSERVSWNRRASAASFARVRVGADPRGLEPAAPATTKLPESTSSPAALSTGSLSPVSSDSSTSSPSARVHDAVARDLVAGAQLEQVVEHDRFDRDLGDVAVAHDPGARRVQHRELVEGALGPHLLDDADERRWRRARRRTSRPGSGRPPGSRRASAPRMALNRVNTLARTISPSVRLVRSPVSLACPRATRSCTSAAVRPSSACRAAARRERASAPM